MSRSPLTQLTALECELLEASRALEPNEAEGDALHLHIERGRRRWLVSTSHGELSVTVHDDELDPAMPSHLPLSDRVTWFLAALHNDQPTLTVADDATAVISTPHVWAGIDLVPQTEPPPQPGSVRTSASVRLPLWRFARTLTAARVMPSGTDEQRLPSPPMWLNLHEQGASLHVDWREFLPSRATYTVPSSQVTGVGTIALPHRRLDEFLRGLGAEHLEDDELELQVSIGELDRHGFWEPAVVLTCGPWRLALVVRNVLAERWYDTVERQLEPFVVTDRDPTEWLVELQGRPVRVRLFSGHPDVARVSTTLGTGFHETLDLLRELGTLNAASTGVRFWLEHDTVWAAVDLPCTRLGDLSDAVRAVGDAAATYGPLLRVWC